MSKGRRFNIFYTTEYIGSYVRPGWNSQIKQVPILRVCSFLLYSVYSYPITTTSTRYALDIGEYSTWLVHKVLSSGIELGKWENST